MEGLAVVVVCLLLGLMLGSFANVVILRVPAGESIIRPGAACPSCTAPIARRDNIPVLSWIVLRGRCRDCGQPISVRYPLVELAVAAVFTAVGARFGLDWALPAFLLFGWLLVVVSVIDARIRRIPNRLTYPLIPALMVLVLLAAVANGTPLAAVRALLGGVSAFALLLVLALINPQGMGMGDVKLAGFIGIGLGYLGWGHVALGLFAGFFIGGLIAGGLLVLRLRGRKDQIPFGPYLALGALLTVLFGEPLISAYVRLTGWA